MNNQSDSEIEKRIDTVKPENFEGGVTSSVGTSQGLQAIQQTARPKFYVGKPSKWENSRIAVWFGYGIKFGLAVLALAVLAALAYMVYDDFGNISKALFWSFGVFAIVGAVVWFILVFLNHSANADAKAKLFPESNLLGNEPSLLSGVFGAGMRMVDILVWGICIVAAFFTFGLSLLAAFIYQLVRVQLSGNTRKN